MKTFLSKIFNKNTLKVAWIVYALLSIVTIVYFADHLFTKDLNKESGKLELNNNWNITINSDHYHNVDLNTFRFPTVDKGTSILMETTLPEDWEFQDAALTFHVRQSTVKMYSDWELFYQYGHDRLQDKKTVGSGIQIINFSDEYKGTTLRILLTVTEDNVFSSFDPIYISEWSDSYRFILTENRLALFSGAFLVVLGIFVSVVTIFASIYSRKYASLLWLSAFSIFMGLWTLCYHNVVIIFSIPTYSVSLLEYMALMMAPLPILGYMYNYVKQLQSKKILLVYKALFIIQVILSVATIVLHTTDIAHSAALLPYSQVLFVVHALFFTYVFLRNSTKGTKKRGLYTAGLAVILLCIMYDLLIYVINRYFGLHLTSATGVSSLGIIVFVGMMILDMVHDISLKIMEEQEKERLIKCAYTDELTQINNRTFCAEYMLALESTKNNNYTIFNFDLNDLKKINDSHGHAQGDLLIKKAASIISEAFSTSGIVGRMGGDEFIAIIPTDNATQIDSLVNHLKELIDNANANDPYLHLSISYGYAANTEFNEPEIEKVYQLADKRMYINKTQYKKG